jgi:two-component system, sensor histidine kinase LadS
MKIEYKLNYWFLVFSLLIMKPWASVSQDVYEIPVNFYGENINDTFYIYDEKDNSPETIAEVTAQDKFRLTTVRVAAYFASNAGHWLRLNIRSKIDRKLILELSQFGYDELDFYLADKNKNIKRYPHLNWKIPISKRLIHSEFYAYPFYVNAGEIYTLYIRGKNPIGSFRMPIRLKTETAFMDTIKQNEWFFGIFTGVTVIILFLGFSFYLLSKDKSYLYYTLSVIFLIVQILTISSYLVNSLLKIYEPMANPVYGNLFVQFFVCFHVKYLRSILLNEASPRYIHKLSNFLTYWALTVSVLMFVCLFYLPLFKYVAYMVYIMYSLLIANLVLNVKEGLKINRSNAIFIIIGSTPFFLYVLYLILTNLRVIKQYSPYNLVLWCLLFENIVLCIALAFRFSYIAKREVKLQKDMNLQLAKVFEAEKMHQQEQIQRLEAQNKLQLEKERISRDLHDNIGSQLAFITSNIDYYTSKMTKEPDIQLKMNDLGDYVRLTTQQLRDTIWATNKENISMNEFVKRAQNYTYKQIENIENLHCDIDYEEFDCELSSAQALQLFRVIQEGINNVQKHSRASLFILKIRQISNKISVQIIDNGIGFDENLIKVDSYGLENMQNRIKELKGEIKITSAPTKGTNIEILI